MSKSQNLSVTVSERYRIPLKPERESGLWVDRIGSGVNFKNTSPGLRILSLYAAVGISEGKGTFYTPETGEIRVEENDVMLLFPGSRHYYIPDYYWDSRWVVWDGAEAEKLVEMGYFTPEKPIIKNAYSTIKEAHTKLSVLMDKETPGAVLERKVILFDMLLALHKHSEIDSTQNAVTVKKAVDYIDANLAKDLTLEEVSKHCGYSIPHFRRIFNAETGVSPKEFIISRKITKAKEYLDSRIPIKEAASMLGFNNESYFRKVFKKVTGITPGRFQNSENSGVRGNPSTSLRARSESKREVHNLGTPSPSSGTKLEVNRGVHTDSATEKWERFSQNTKFELGFAEIKTVGLSSEIRDQISAKFAKVDISGYPEYISKSSDLRSDPLKLYPWAKSVIVAAFPFSDIPDHPPFLKPATSLEFSGKIAGYAMKQDYHKFGKEKLAKFAERLKEDVNCEIRTDICIDTAPVAEKIIAEFAGIGRIGLNSCLLVKNHGSGCFLGEIFTSVKISGSEFQVPSSELSGGPNEFWSCQGCNRCLNGCPTGAISRGENFRCKLCRSYLTMEKRGELTNQERRLLGDFIFGCDICTDLCPRSNIPPAFEVDLEWLLMSPSGELKRAINGTTLEYAGATLLQRNALAVLENKNNDKAFELINKFVKKTGSDLLRKTAEDILRTE
jgi:epoxyqueuosine reductase